MNSPVEGIAAGLNIVAAGSRDEKGRQDTNAELVERAENTGIRHTVGAGSRGHAGRGSSDDQGHDGSACPAGGSKSDAGRRATITKRSIPARVTAYVLQSA